MGPAEKLRLLVLSVGSLAAQRFFVALGPRRAQCVLIGTNSLAEAAGNFRCDVAYLSPPAAASDAYVERVTALIRAERPHLVIPTRDDDVVELAKVAEGAPGTEAVLLTGTLAAARMLHDKAESARFAQRHGLPFAPTAMNVGEARALAGSDGLPLIGKPRGGYATRGVVLLRTIAEIERAFELRPDLIAQAYLDPPPNMAALVAPPDAGLPFFFSFPEARQYFLQIVVGPDGAISEPFGTLSLQVGGQALRSERCGDPDLLETGRAYARAAASEGWRGPLNVQLKRTPAGTFSAHDLNGRFSGGTAARALMGFDEPREVINRFLPWAEFPPLGWEEVDVVNNYLTGFPIPRGGVAALEGAGKWVRADRASGGVVTPAGTAPDRPLPC